MTDHLDFLKMNYNFLIAFNIVLKFKSEFRKCVEKLSAEILAEEIFCKNREDEFSMFYDIVTSDSCIFLSHSDNSESEYIILQFYKTKLII